MMQRPDRHHPLWYAFVAHRLSGLALVLFVPVHFYVLGLALTDAPALDGLLRWTERPSVKVAEFGLVFLLAIHFFGGLRLLALEFLGWNPHQKTLAAAAAALAFLTAGTFLLGVV